ncbi:MAG: DUF2953 domain-containing protein [Ruminococcus sp.]|nr:DUF2953 domain-containing protein [Ruminococcus sp.]
MIALYIILGILLLILLILLIRVQVFMQYSETVTLSVKVLFVKITLLPAKEKKKKPKKEKPKEPKQEQKKPKKEEKEKEKKPSYLSKLKEKKGLSGLLSLFTSLAKIAVGMLKSIFSHIVIKKMDVGIALSGEDASSVAVNYGRLCSVLYPAVNVIASVTVCKDYNVVVEPVFDPDKPTEVFADVHAYLRLIFVVAAAIKAAIKLLIVRIRL